MLKATSLRKATLPENLFRCPSPASIQPTRLALLVNDDTDDSDFTSCSAYFATGSSVYKVQISGGESLVNRGKKSLLIPSQAQITDASIVDRFPHPSEIQSIAVKELERSDSFILGSVDSYGHLIVTKHGADDKDGERPILKVRPRDCGTGEGSWAGLSFSSNQCCTIAVAHSFSKSIDIYDQEIHLRNFRTLWYPSSITFVNDQIYGNGSSILAVAEGCQLTMLDLRIKENGGCLKRISGSPGNILYAASVSPNGNIAVGGADRTVTIYDPRRWSAISRWVHCSKYEITGLAFSSVHPDYIYIQGVDYEVFCGEWRDCTKIFSFRGDSNWLGFSKCLNKDVLGGWCDSGSIFVADVVACKEELIHEVGELECAEILAPDPFQKECLDKEVLGGGCGYVADVVAC